MKRTLLVVCLVMLIACTPKQSNEQEPIKIGSILPLTGNVAAFGQSMRRGAVIAMDEVNAAGGINGRQLEIIFEDGRCSGKDGSNAANKLINSDKVTAILGGACSTETLGAAPLSERAKVVQMSPWSSVPSVTNAGDYIFRDYPSDLIQGKYAAEYTYNQLGARKVAILYALHDWSLGIKDVFKKKFEELGGKVITEESFEMDTRDLRTQLTKIKEAEPDLLYFLGHTEASVIGLMQIKELGINVPILGGDTWSDPEIHQKAGKNAEDILWVEPYAPLSEEFKNKIFAKFGQVDVTSGTGQIYDAVKIVANIMQKVGSDGTKIKEELYKVKDYDGVSGKIGFDENGDLIEASFMVNTLKNGKIEEKYR